MAGEIVDAGASTKFFKKGDRVTSIYDQLFFYGSKFFDESLGGHLDGTLQEYRLFGENVLLSIPEHLTYEEASCFAVAGITAWNALFGVQPILPGQSVVLQGTGGVSMFGLSFAHAAGTTTIVTSSSDEKLELAKKLGATYGINYRKTPNWDRAVNEVTDGAGADRIFDNVGINEIEHCFGCVANGGMVVSVGFLGGQPQKVPDITMLALYKGAMLRAIRGGSKQQFEEMFRFVAARKLKPLIDKVFPFEQTVQALEYLSSGKHVGKVVVRVVLH